MMMGVEDALCIQVAIPLVERERAVSEVGWCKMGGFLKPHLAHSRMRLSATFASDPCNHDEQI